MLLLEKGDQLAKEPSIDEADRKQTEDDTKALRERWDRLKADEHDKKKRFVSVCKMCLSTVCVMVVTRNMV